MAKRTASVTGNYVEFQAAVLRALPRDVDPEVVLEWVNNRERLTHILREVFVPSKKPHPADTAYYVVVNYGMSVEDAVKSGWYDRADNNITSRNFPTNRTGIDDLLIEPIRFNKNISTNQVFRELDKMGMRPAELRELLAFGKEYPYVQREIPVVALGSVWRDSNGIHRVPKLGRYGLERVLFLSSVEPGWGKHCHFAAVRK